MLGKMKDLMSMKKQADKIKKELDACTVEYDNIRGIKVTINGSQCIKSIEIDEGRINPEFKSRLEQDIMRSINGAIGKSQSVAAKKMKDVMPGGFPGL